MQPKGTGQLIEPQGARHAAILGVGGYRPQRVIDNAEVCTWIDSSDEWIRERSGIVTRHWAAPDETVVDMSVPASRAALERAQIRPEQVSAVVVATISHPFQTPAAAPMIAHRLGCVDAAAFDISAACAGYCHAVAMAGDMVRGGSAEYVLVVGAEKLSSLTDPHDRGSAFIFGDGAGAAVIGPSESTGIGPTVWGSDGEQWDVIRQRRSWWDIRDDPDGAVDDDGLDPATMSMAGPSVFRWAVWSMAPVAQQAIDKAGIQPADLDAFIPHQANMRIIDAMIKQLRLPADIAVARDIAQTGNTSAASIPLATERMLREGQAPHGGLALQIGFGAGLSYAAQVVVLP